MTAKILVVDDDPIVCEVASSTLRSAGYDVATAGDGAAALSMLADATFDLVITDLAMPHLDGIGVLRHIRSDPCTRNLPVIVITTSDDANSVEKSYNEGATSFLIKPLNFAMFLHHVGFVLRGAQNDAELRKLRADAVAESNRKSELLAVIAHEFRTPLHAVIGYSELLRDEAKGPLGCDDYKEYASCIFEAADRVNKILGDISILTQNMVDGIKPNSQPHPISEIVEGARESVAALAKIKNVKIDVPSLPGPEISLDCDRALVIKAFGHILENAVKFSPASMPVSIEWQLTAQGNLALIASDYGPGMDLHVAEQLMAPFVQASMAKDRSADGLGIGLTISRTIAIAHGGRLSVEANNGQGTIAKLILPAKRVILSDYTSQSIVSETVTEGPKCVVI